MTKNANGYVHRIALEFRIPKFNCCSNTTRLFPSDRTVVQIWPIVPQLSKCLKFKAIWGGGGGVLN